MPLITKKFNDNTNNPIESTTTILGGIERLEKDITEGKSIYIDGAGYNGLISRICVATDKEIAHIITYFEERTNNQMEYEALIYAIKLAKQDPKRMETLRVYTDSELMYKQLIGAYKIRDLILQFLHDEIIKELEPVVWNLDLNWLRREHNIAGKILEKHK